MGFRLVFYLPFAVSDLPRAQVVFANLGLDLGQGEVDDQSQGCEGSNRTRRLAEMVTAETRPGAGDGAGIEGPLAVTISAKRLERLEPSHP